MTNEQYSNMMVAIATIEAKIEKLEALLEAPVIENKLEIQQPVLPEHLSNFWNDKGEPQKVASTVVRDLNLFSKRVEFAAQDYYDHYRNLTTAACPAEADK